MILFFNRGIHFFLKRVIMNHFPEKEEGPENYVDNLFEDNHHQRRRITTSRGYEFRWRRGPEFISSQYINEVYIGGWPSYPQIVEFRNPSKNTTLLDQ